MTALTRDEEETVRLGRRIGRALKPPRVVLLYGDLGSGKTALTRGIAQGMGAAEDAAVTSPTFTLVNLYPTARGPLHHLDLYRLNSLRDLYSIGIEDILAGEGVVVVEWAEKLRLPLRDPLRIQILPGEGPDDRVFEIHPELVLPAE